MLFISTRSRAEKNYIVPSIGTIAWDIG